MSRRDMRQSAFWILALGFICLVPTLVFSQSTLQLKSYLASNCCATIAARRSKERVTNDRQAGPQSRDNPAPLVLGAPVERTIVGAETHYYTLTLSVGQFLHLSVEQHGVDVKVGVFAPSGSKILEVNRVRLGIQGETVRLIAADSGVYTVEIATADPNAAPGKYIARIMELRNATAGDPARMRAHDVGLEAGGLMLLHTRESVTKALELLKQAAELWRQLGDPGLEGQNLYVAVDACNDLGEYQMAISLAEQALSVFRTIGNQDDSGVLTCEGESYYYLSRYQEALACYERALQTCHATHDYHVAGWTLNNMGSVYEALGDPQKALDFYSQSLRTYESLGSAPREPVIPLTNIGGLLASLGDGQKALEYLQRALPLWQEIDDRWGEARVLHRMGVAYNALRQYENALGFYDQALKLWRNVGDRFNEAKTLDAAGMTCKAQGDTAKAEEFFNLALAARQAIGDRQGMAGSLYHLALVERDGGHLREALMHSKQAIDQAESVRGGVLNDELRSS